MLLTRIRQLPRNTDRRRRNPGRGGVSPVVTAVIAAASREALRQPVPWTGVDGLAPAAVLRNAAVSINPAAPPRVDGTALSAVGPATAGRSGLQVTVACQVAKAVAAVLAAVVVVVVVLVAAAVVVVAAAVVAVAGNRNI